MLKKIIGVILVSLCVFGQIIEFDNTAVQNIFQAKKAALFLFSSANQQSSQAKQELKKYDETNVIDLILTVSDQDDGHGLFDKLAEYLGINAQQTPKILYLSGEFEKFQYDLQTINAPNIAQFVARVKEGKVQPFLKSAEIPEPSDSPVKVFVGKNFKKEVLQSEKEFLVKFYAPWCGHCKTLAPHYEKAAAILANNPNIVLVKVDSTENQVQGVDIQGFPTLKFWGKDKSVPPIQYNGERTTQGIISWLKQHTSYDWIESTTDEL